MGLADEIAAGHERLYSSRGATATCTVNRIEGYLDDEDRAALRSLLDDQRVFGTNIADLLNGWGTKIVGSLDEDDGDISDARRAELEHLAQLCSGITDSTVQRHRRGKCKCGDR